MSARFMEDEPDEFPVAKTYFDLGEEGHQQVENVEDPLTIDVDRGVVSHQEDPLQAQEEDDVVLENVVTRQTIPRKDVTVPVAPRDKKKLPPMYENMSFGEFTKEMRESIHQIAQESLSLFRKDPREYHPFYLRIFKYVTIGQHLGYVSSEQETVLTNIWGGFLQFAKTNYEAAMHQPVVHNGERSPYAVYLLTRKVVIKGKVVPVTRDENVRRRQFRELEATAKKLREEWLRKNRAGGEIREDVRAIFNFFQKCKVIIHPADMVKMNNIWSKFLLSRGNKPSLPCASSLDNANVVKLDECHILEEAPTKPPQISITTAADSLPEIIVDAPSTSPQEKKMGKKVTVKVVLRSSIESPPSPGPSPPPSPGPASPSSPCASPPPAFSTDDTTATTLAAFRIGRRKQIFPPAISNSTAPPLRQRRKVKRRKIAAAPTLGKMPLPTTRLLLQKKSRILGQLKKSKSSLTGDQRQLHLEKLLNQPGAKVGVTPKIKRVLTKPVNPALKSTKTSLKKRPFSKSSSPKGASSQTNDSKCTASNKSSKKSVPLPPPTKSKLLQNKMKKRQALLKFSQRGNADARQLRLEAALSGPTAGGSKSVRRKKRLVTAAKTEKTSPVEGQTKVTRNLKKKKAPTRSAIPKGIPPEVETTPTSADVIDSGDDGDDDGPMEDTGIVSVDESDAGGTLKEPPKRKRPSRSTPLKGEARQCDICKKECLTKSKLWKHKVNIHDCPAVSEAQSLGLQLSKIKQCSLCPKWTFTGISISSHVHKKHPAEYKEWSLNELKRQKRWNILRDKYRRLPSRCPVCEESVRVGFLAEHLKSEHGIIEDCWRCKFCPHLKFEFRQYWLTHMNLVHVGDKDMKEFMEEAKKLHTNIRKVEVKEGGESPPPEKTADPAPVREPEEELDHDSLIDPEGREKCDECHKLFDPLYLPVHKKANHGSKRPMVQCPLCIESFQNGLSIWSHYCKDHLKDGDLDDLDPVPPEHRFHGYVRARYTKLSNMPQPGNQASRVCDQCGREFSSVSAVQRHIFTIHGEGTLRENYFQCDQCPKTYKCKDIMEEHKRRVHDGMSISRCPHCNRDLQSSGKLWRHMMDSHGDSATDAATHCKVDFLSCPLCQEDLLVDRQFPNHLKTQHPDQSAEILKTHTVRARRAVFRKYVRKQSLKTPEERDKERELDGWRGKVRPAYKVIAQKESGPCPECGQELVTGLGRHRMLRHGVELDGGYYCSVEGCNSRMKTKSSLRRHMRASHCKPLEEKIVAKKMIKVVEEGKLTNVYQCTMCQVYMYYYDQIKVHVVAVHPEICQDLVTPVEIPCPHCAEEKFENVTLARQHVEELHPELCWRCPECSKVVLDTEDLSKHFVEEHNESKEGNGKGGEAEEEDVFLKLKDVKPVTPWKFEKLARWQEVLVQSSLLNVKCEVCQQEVRLQTLSNHLHFQHGIKEDGEPFECPFGCQGSRRYGKRRMWICHMLQNHEQQVSLEELLKEASKVRTKVPWSQMKVAKKKGKKPKSGKKASREEEEENLEESEEEEPEFHSSGDERDFGRNNMEAVERVDRSSLKRKASTKARNYKKLAGEEEDDEGKKGKHRDVGDTKIKTGAPPRKRNVAKRDDGDGKTKTRKTSSISAAVKKAVSTRRGRSGGTVTKGSAPIVPLRTSTRIRKPARSKYGYSEDEEDEDDDDDDGYTNNRKRKGANSKKNISNRPPGPNELEKDKRLVVRLERLREQQVKRYLRGRDTSGERGTSAGDILEDSTTVTVVPAEIQVKCEDPLTQEM